MDVPVGVIRRSEVSSFLSVSQKMGVIVIRQVGEGLVSRVMRPGNLVVPFRVSVMR